MKALRSASRPIPARMRQDLVFHEVSYAGVPYQVVEDPVSLQYARLREDQFSLLSSLDGTVSPHDLLQEMKRRFPNQVWTLPRIQQGVADFHRKSLIVADRPGQSRVLRNRWSEERWKKIVGVVLQPLSIKFPGIRTTPWLDVVYRLTGWLLHPVSLLALAAVCLWAWTLLLLNLRDFEAALPAFQQFFGWKNLPAMWLTLAGTKVAHELGHAVVCRSFGAKCHEMGVMLLLLSPCLYCDVSDSWTLRNKWHRIAIAAAGMGVEFVLSSLAILVWYYTSDGPWHHLALNVFFVTAVTTVIFNANPLMKMDGYYILSDGLEIPNLRARADKRFGELCEAFFLGRDLPPITTEPETPRWWFGFYSLACLVYLGMVMTGSLWLTSLILRPQLLDSIGIVLASVMLSLMGGRWIYRMVMTLSSRDKKPVKRPRLAITLIGLFLLTVVALSIPVPGWGSASCVVESDDLREVRTYVPGQVARIRTKPGQPVRSGDVLVELENSEIEEKGLELRTRIATERARRDTAAARDDTALKALSDAALQGLAKELDEQEQAESRLVVHAPMNGLLVDAPPAREEPQNPRRRQLGGWFGSPLHPDNAGALLETGTLLGVLAPDRPPLVIAYLDQTQYAECSIGKPLSVRLNAYPNDLLNATIEALSSEEVASIPPALSVKSGGPIATTTSDHGTEDVSTVLYRARLRLDPSTIRVADGMRGDVLVPLQWRSLWSWGCRWLARTFRFEWI